MKRILFALMLAIMIAGCSQDVMPTQADSSLGEMIGSKVVSLYFQMPDGSIQVVPQIIAIYENGAYPSTVDELQIDSYTEAGATLVHIQQ